MSTTTTPTHAQYLTSVVNVSSCCLLPLSVKCCLPSDHTAEEKNIWTSQKSQQNNSCFYAGLWERKPWWLLKIAARSPVEEWGLTEVSFSSVEWTHTVKWEIWEIPIRKYWCSNMAGSVFKREEERIVFTSAGIWGRLVCSTTGICSTAVASTLYLDQNTFSKLPLERRNGKDQLSYHTISIHIKHLVSWR